MIEALTPGLLSALLLLLALLTPSLTLALSGLLLWIYHRAVVRYMSDTGGYDAATGGGAQTVLAARRPGSLPLREVLRGPWRVALVYLLAGAALATVFAGAAHVVFPHRLGVAGSAVSVWIYAWPALLAALLIVPASALQRMVAVAVYFAVYMAFTLWASQSLDIPATEFGAVRIPARSSATPETALRLWIAVNGPPTLLAGLALNRWVRAVAPLVLAFVTISLGGVLVLWLGMLSKLGSTWLVEGAVWTGLHVVWLVGAALLAAVLACSALGWALARWLARAYRRLRANELSLRLDALAVLFAMVYGMWLILGGLEFAWVPVVALVAYGAALWAARGVLRPPFEAAAGLTFLRVFSLGPRSERLFDDLAAYWLRIGSMQMITGPDMARSTVAPHVFLDFLSGRLGSHFVRDRASLARSLAAVERRPDRTGRYRMNNFFCHADTWQYALQELVTGTDLVLMDLRSFRDGNAGCTHELRHLVHHVPLSRCLVIVDDTTDGAFLDTVLADAWQHRPPDSPNLGDTPGALECHHLRTSRDSEVREIVSALCARAGA